MSSRTSTPLAIESESTRAAEAIKAMSDLVDLQDALIVGDESTNSAAAALNAIVALRNDVTNEGRRALASRDAVERLCEDRDGPR